MEDRPLNVYNESRDDNENPSWDPMRNDSISYMNTPSFRINDAGARLTGCVDQSLRDIPCPFYDGETPGRCFKGAGCKYKHGQYSQKVLSGMNWEF